MTTTADSGTIEPAGDKVMSDITLSIPDEVLLALKVNADHLGAELRLSAAVKLYELGRISSGAAAKPCLREFREPCS